MPSAGSLRNLLELQVKTTEQDAQGGEVTTWAKVRRLWCRIMPVRGQEMTREGRDVGLVTHRISTRFVRGLELGPQHRLVKIGAAECPGRVFDITSAVNVNERDRLLEIECTEQVSGEAV